MPIHQKLYVIDLSYTQDKETSLRHTKYQKRNSRTGSRSISLSSGLHVVGYSPSGRNSNLYLTPLTSPSPAPTVTT